MQLTKLEIVQRALAALDADNVSSIDDTLEATQIGQIVDTVYEELLTERPWPHLFSIGQLEVTDVPNEMRLPSDVLQVNWIRYDGSALTYMEFDSFDDMLQSRLGGDDLDDAGAYTNKAPYYWSSLDDETIMFDGYDEVLVSSLTRCKFLREPAKMYNNTDVPDLPSRFHPVLLDGVFANVFLHMKGDDSASGLYFRQYATGRTRMQRWATRLNQKNKVNAFTNYGRKGFGSTCNILTECVNGS